ncbi:choline transporter-like 2 isoform X2 [Leptidea sinapis]|uniref:choline transporter-like 2 isoform X2 n=1 Tax=Leptidea sinapis TaxID=189913 RepID=UPI0021C25D11|nr:choline transporter-like 2 isoform X2 [Leptidea sinapis]
MGKDYGEPIRYDPDFNGPVHNRSCTDILWLIVFILFLGAWGYVGYYSATRGSVEKLLAPIDSRGRRCGLDSGLEDKKYLMFFNIAKCLSPGTPITGCPTTQVCVENCPKTTTLIAKELAQNPNNFESLRASMVCVDEVNTQSMSSSQALQYMQEEKCAGFLLASQPVLFRCIGDLSTLQCKSSNANTVARDDEACVRNPEAAQKTLLNSATALDSYVGWIAASWVTFLTRNERDTHILSSQIVQDLVQSRWYMAGALVAVVILCFIYILLLRWVVGPVVWLSIAGFLALLGFAMYLCYKNFEYYKANPVGLYQTTNLKGYAQSIFAKYETWLVLLIALAIIFVILLLVVIFLRSRITIAIALIREGSKAVTAIKTTVLFPIFPWILQCGVIAYGVLVLMFLMSIGDSAFRVVNFKNDTTCDCAGIYTEEGQECNPAKFVSSCRDTASVGGALPCSLASCHFTGVNNPNNIIYLHLVNLLGFFWMMSFISGVTDMMLASTFSTWYWTFRKKDLPFFTLTSGIYRTLRYHLGTVAFGALIIAIVQVIRVILEYIDRKVKKFDNPLTRCIMCCCKCAFWCLESFLKFVNKNAYIMCAVHGKNFCRSASDAFSLLMRNIVRVVVLDKVADFIFFLSKLLISVGVGFAVFYLLEWNYVYEVTKGQRLHYNYVPAIILSVATYLVSTVFFNVYSMAVDTLFLCFLEDCERNDGSPEKPYFMSKNLMKILGKRNKKMT